MTIFSTIKYPISDIPTYEQLNALPRAMYEKWATDVYQDQYTRNPHTTTAWYFHPAFLAAKMNDLSEYQRREYVHELRLRIQEIDNDDLS